MALYRTTICSLVNTGIALMLKFAAKYRTTLTFAVLKHSVISSHKARLNVTASAEVYLANCPSSRISKTPATKTTHWLGLLSITLVCIFRAVSFCILNGSIA